MSILTVENLSKYYQSKKSIFSKNAEVVKAVDGVSFEVFEGETLGLVGESGCGKTTIGKQIVGLEKPTDGKILYRGQEIQDFDGKDMKEIRTDIQMVFQDPYSSLNPRKHIYEILAQPMLYHKISTPETIEQDLERLLDMVGLPKNVLGRYPKEFSGGQRQRIVIAKALSLNPKLLICDEPVSALDVSVQAQILNLLKELQKELKLSTIFIGHGLSAVRYVSDRIAVMYLGKIVELGNAEDVFKNPVHPYTKALLAASPIPDPSIVKKEDVILQGEIGSNTNPPTGCRFHPRCPYAAEHCRIEEPVLKPCGEWSVACHYSESFKI